MSRLEDFQRLRLAADSPGALAAYLGESRRPLTSLIFVLPLLGAYELGVLVVPATMRNGADAWMRRLLDLLGFGGYFLLPCLTVAVLLAWHYLLRQPWRIRRGVLLGMLAESAAMGVLLIGLARLQGVLFSMPTGKWFSVGFAVPLASSFTSTLGPIVAFCGAGLYEEVLFRLLLVPASIWMAARLGLGGKWPTAAAAVSTSLFFALAHYVGPSGDTWDLYSFAFRFAAGIFFALLFIYRGFGIAAGTHALYDVLVGVKWM
jgi:membrane protease YdiL (CAAX protease family)